MYNYSKKKISLESALCLVKSGDYIVSGSSANNAKLFFDHIHQILGKVKNVTICNLNCPYNHEYLKEEYKDYLQVDSLFYAGAMRRAHNNGNLSFVPGHVQMFYKRIERVKPNLFVCAASMPDKHGYVSISLSTLYDTILLEKAEKVILEINPKFPRTFGDVTVHLSNVDYLLEADYYPPEIPETESSEVDKIIGKLVSEQIPDQACIQVGIGGIPDAVVRQLADKKDLGIHSEMITTGMMKLINAGVITNKFKKINRNKTVCSFAFGTKEFYEFLDDNPSIEFLRGSYTNDPAVIAMNDNMMSINTTIEVDLTGQCCSESIGNLQLSGTGGQLEMAEGAQLSKGGKSFICLRSIARTVDSATGEKLEVSTIVPTIKTGAVVTLPRANVDYVVTEFGIANLRGTNIKERVQALIGIAHPKFREELLEEAKKLQYI